MRPVRNSSWNILSSLWFYQLLLLFIIEQSDLVCWIDFWSNPHWKQLVLRPFLHPSVFNSVSICPQQGCDCIFFSSLFCATSFCILFLFSVLSWLCFHIIPSSFVAHCHGFRQRIVPPVAPSPHSLCLSFLFPNFSPHLGTHLWYNKDETKTRGDVVVVFDGTGEVDGWWEWRSVV